jgi:flavin-dependent dehydrogenase
MDTSAVLPESARQQSVQSHYDLVCIGGGPAGQSAAELATMSGLRALVIEWQVLGGGVVTNAGIPTKTLREAALLDVPDPLNYRLDLAR